MSDPLFEKYVFFTYITAWNEPRRAEQTRHDIGHDRSVKVRQHHDVKGGGALYQLHRAIVDDDLLVHHGGVIFGYFSGRFEEGAVDKFPEI